MTNPIRWLWPALEVHAELPDAKGKEPGTEIVLEHARDLVAGQSAAYDSLDAKAATIIGATLVVLGLVLPNVATTEAIHRVWLAVLLILVTYTLVASLAGYSVSTLHVGVKPSTLTPAMAASEATARAAVAVHLLRAYVQNEPVLRRKAAFVRRALLGIAVSVVPLVGLSLTGAMK